MLAIRYGIFGSFLKALNRMMDQSFMLQFGKIEFSLLVGSVLCVAAGGYILNDIHDLDTDKVNTPNRPLVKHPQKLDLMNRVGFAFMFAGIAIGAAIGYKLGNIYLGLIHVIAASSLYIYAIQFKRTVLLGNIIIAFLSGLVPLTVGLFDIPLLQNGYGDVMKTYKNFNFNFLAYWAIGFSLFAFILSFARELIKDIEDIAGDQQAGIRTFANTVPPIVAKSTVTLVYLGFLASLWHVHVHYLPDNVTFVFALVVSGGVLLSIYTLIKTNYKRSSLFTKLTMLIGICYAFAVAYMVQSDSIMM